MVIWPVFLIASYWLSQYVVETIPLPNEHLKEATLCLMEYIGEDILLELFGRGLTHENCLGDICNENLEILQSKINEAFIQKARRRTMYSSFFSRSVPNTAYDGGLKIQECLAEKGLPEVYTKILNYGTKVWLNQDFDEISDFAKYIVGLCLKDYGVDYDELENEDKRAAFLCLEDCAKDFMSRIQNILSITSHNIVIILQENKKVKSIPGASRRLTAEIYDEFINNFKALTRFDGRSADPRTGAPSSSARIFDIDRITTWGKTLMTRYSQVYGILYKYLDETDTSYNPDIHSVVKAQLHAITTNTTHEEKILNMNLRNSFTDYEKCAKVRCYMKAPKNVPLYELIHDEAVKEDTDIPLEEQTFYMALTKRLDD